MSHTGTDLWRASASSLAEMISSGRASSREVVEAHLCRIDAVNPTVNAVTVVLREDALAAADAADEVVARGGELPPLHGVPFTVKENIDLAGSPTTQGVPALAETYPELDSPNIERLRRAGAIPIGRTNCPDFGIRWHTDSELRGATINPWDRARTPGGSSGGEAAAIATGMSPLGVGGDVGGSLRWPAQCCGVSSLKPTLGRIPHATTIEPVDAPISTQIMMVEGPMARRVADLRTAFEVMAGPTWRDPWAVPAPLRGPAPTAPVRVALAVDPAGLGTAPHVQRGLRDAATALAGAGYAIEEIEPPSVDIAARTWLDILHADMGPALEVMSFPFGADTARFVDLLFASASPIQALSTVVNFTVRQSIQRAWGAFQETYPLILAPIYTELPFEVGTDLTARGVAEILVGMRMAVAVNALGLPAVAQPIGVEDGLPQVVQIIGPRFREDLCLDAAAAVEERVGIITPVEPREDRPDPEAPPESLLLDSKEI